MTRPQDDAQAEISRFWTSIDQRASAVVHETLQRTMGVPRARGMSVNIPLAGMNETPIPGWLQSVVLFHNCRITAWEIYSLVTGSVSLDIRVSTLPASPATPPTLTSLPGASHYLSLNGYCTGSYDTSGWTQRDIQAGSAIHIYVLSATGIKQTILGLQLLDLYGKVLQI